MTIRHKFKKLMMINIFLPVHNLVISLHNLVVRHELINRIIVCPDI